MRQGFFHTVYDHNYRAPVDWLQPGQNARLLSRLTGARLEGSIPIFPFPIGLHVKWSMFDSLWP